MNVREWLKASEQFLPKEELEVVRAKAKDKIAKERAEALARAAQLEADLEAFESPDDVTVEEDDEGPGALPPLSTVYPDEDLFVADHAEEQVVKVTSRPIPVRPSAPIRPVAPVPSIHLRPGERLASMSIDTLAVRFAAAHPGTPIGPMLTFVKAARPDCDPKGLYGSLSRLSKPGGPLRKDGDRTTATYYPTEDGGA
jgi:hypothetical protein